MVTKRIKYELATKANSDELLELYQGVHPTLGWSHEYIDWQYYQNPVGDARVWVAKDDNKIIATYVAIPHTMYVKGRVTTGWRVQDVMTKPEYRGMGIYHQLSKMAARFLFRDEFPLNFSFPNESSHDGFIRTGWTDSLRIPLRVLTGLGSVHSENLCADISPIHSFDHRTSRIWQTYLDWLDVGIDRSSTYLAWRYFASPRRDIYFPYKVTKGADELVLILKHFERADGSKWIHLCDLFYSECNRDLITLAVRQWIHFAQDWNCDSLSCWTPLGSNLDSILDDYDFSRQTILNRWLVVSTASTGRDGERTNEGMLWHLSMGDSDVF